MIATLTYYITRVVIFIHREIEVGVGMARAHATVGAPNGLMQCGMAMDDHEDGVCEDAFPFPMYGEDDDE